VARGRSLNLLKEELGNSCCYLEIPDYSSPYSKKDFSVPKFLSYFPVYMNQVIKEHEAIKKLVRREGYERIVSDNRFGIHIREIPSYFISHQLRFLAPGRVKLFERATEGFNYSFSKNSFTKFLVPDFKEDSLSGDLSHNLKYFKETQVEYLGILSDLRKKEVPEDIDYFISISGPEPQRTVFEHKVLRQAPRLEGKVAVALGKPEDLREKGNGHVRVFGYLTRRQQEDVMNRAKLIIARPGYSTLMELVALGKKALFVPTPGQTEQVYLAEYHRRQGNFYSVDQDSLNLARDVEKAKRYEGVYGRVEPEGAVRKFMSIVFGE
jgi:UDP-N-acetylglucosamine transferase subunit ALG13